MAQTTVVHPVQRERRGAAYLARCRNAIRGLSLPRVLFFAVIGAFTVFYVVHLSMLHDRFWTTGYDLGIFDQATWLVAQGKTFITIRGLTFWGHHVNPGLVLFAPFYWLGAGPRFLNGAMVVAYAAGAFPVFRIAKHHLRNEWIALALVVAYLLQTGGQWVLRETFHPEVMAIAPMLYAYLAVLERRWRAYWIWLLAAVCWKEDIAITIAMLGVVLALRGQRKQGIITLLAGVTYYFFCTKVVLPHFTPAGPFYSEFLGNLGNTPFALAKNALVHPTRFTDQFQEAQWYRYPRDLAQPYAFTSFFSWPGLLLALPQVVLNLLTKHSYAWSIRWHYVSMPTVGFTIASIEGVANLRRLAERVRGSGRELVASVVVAAVAVAVTAGIAAAGYLAAASAIALGFVVVAVTAVAWPTRLLESIGMVVAASAVVMSAMWAPSYGWAYNDPGMWPTEITPHVRVLRNAVNLVPDDAVISVSYNFSPHLAHREFVYEFPNPWRNSYWGVDQRLPDGRVTAWPPARDPDSIQWIAVDKGTLGPESLSLLKDVLASPKWMIVFDEQNVVVAHRS
ncbi:MAG: DUF2079 domain-containing protein [Actinobacteria bacterium]|uniref:Unannotated protein n=1 Tax=freshwater metagenome TaxID=449393 RepID=A0A6J7PGE0_9ZZZZ|nr:DUF2079 domain-containing protein [Actinomycetota bacterium]